MAWHPFRNFGLKVAALGLGTLLFFTVSGPRVERTISGVPGIATIAPVRIAQPAMEPIISTSPWAKLIMKSTP